MLRQWLARLAMSFIILSAVLAWQAYRAPTTDGRTVAYALGAAASAGCGLAGVRERHRRDHFD